MPKLNTLRHSRTHRILIFGPPKSGKTQLAGELATHGYNLIWIDMENGHETLFKLPLEAQERIELISLRDTKKYPIAIETVLKLIKGKVSICEQHGKVNCLLCKKESAPFTDVDVHNMDNKTAIVFDSLTQLTTSAINNITKAQPEDYKLQTDDWGHLAKLIDVFATTIQQADYNVIAISHETEAETEGKKRTLVPVAGSRNSSRNIAKAFDHVIYAERKNKKHIFASSTAYMNTILTGSRTDICLEKEAEASLISIFEQKEYPQDAPVAGAKQPASPVSSATAKQPAKQPANNNGAVAAGILAKLRQKK